MSQTKEVRSHGHFCLCSFLHAHCIVQAACVSSPWGLGSPVHGSRKSGSSLHTVEEGQGDITHSTGVLRPAGRNVAHEYEFNVLTYCFQKVCSENFSLRALVAAKIGCFNWECAKPTSASGDYPGDVVLPTSVKEMHESLKAMPSITVSVQQFKLKSGKQFGHHVADVIDVFSSWRWSAVKALRLRSLVVVIRAPHALAEAD